MLWPGRLFDTHTPSTRGMRLRRDGNHIAALDGGPQHPGELSRCSTAHVCAAGRFAHERDEPCQLVRVVRQFP